MRHIKRHVKLALALPVLLGLSATQAHAQLVITPIFDSSITSDPNAAAIMGTINSAIGVYETDFINPINVSILFKADQGISLGQSSTYIGNVSYTSYRNALISTKALGTDSTAFESFLTAGAANPVNGGSVVTDTTAGLRALGFAASPPAGQADSTISLKTSITNDSRAGVQDPNKYDLFAVASHEINEVLGLGSSLDGLSNGAAAPSNVGTLDFFRFSGPGIRSFSTAANANSYFSVDGGTTSLVHFNQSQNGDYHDWDNASQGPGFVPQVQDAFSTPGTVMNLGTAELTALTDIGYNRAPVPAVPEASSSVSLGVLLALGLGGIALARRRKTARTTANIAS